MPAKPFIRVRDKDTGHHYSVREDAVNEDAHQVLPKQSAVDKSGRPLVMKPNTSASKRGTSPTPPESQQESTSKAGNPSAETSKESK